MYPGVGLVHRPSVGTIVMTHVQHFFVEYLFIYLKKSFNGFKFNFPKFEQLRNRYAKNTFCVMHFVIVTLIVFNFQ
jgi:hypothetical protein